MIDRAEQIRRGQSSKPKGAAMHPYLQIEHRIIDSMAFRTLSFSSQALLVLLCRQLTRDNNGNIQASFRWCQPYGFNSTHTLQRAIAELITHGLIYRTRSHGANGIWARYALTWLPIKNPEGLFLDGFVPNAWRDFEPGKDMTNDKSRWQKMLEVLAKNAVSPPKNHVLLVPNCIN